MGNIHCSIPTKLALELRDKFGLRAFVETGLGQGTSALWAAKHFDEAVSIETSHDYIAQFGQHDGVKVIEGDSAIEMIEVMSHLTMPTLFWLDGHTDDYTPILAELAAINFSPLPHVIMIDDWRLFGTLPKWPIQEKVITFARNGGTRDVYEIDDVLVCTP